MDTILVWMVAGITGLISYSLFRNGGIRFLPGVAVLLIFFRGVMFQVADLSNYPELTSLLNSFVFRFPIYLLSYIFFILDFSGYTIDFRIEKPRKEKPLPVDLSSLDGKYPPGSGAPFWEDGGKSPSPTLSHSKDNTPSLSLQTEIEKG